MALAEEFGKNAATVLALLCFLPESLNDLAFPISVDNRFTAFQFTIFEAQRNWIRSYRLIRKNKVERKCQSVPIKEMTKSSKRGDICAAVAKNTDRNEEVKLVRLKIITLGLCALQYLEQNR